MKSCVSPPMVRMPMPLSMIVERIIVKAGNKGIRPSDLTAKVLESGWKPGGRTCAYTVVMATAHKLACDHGCDGPRSPVVRLARGVFGTL